MNDVTYITKDEYALFIESIKDNTNPCRCCTMPRNIEGNCIEPCTNYGRYKEIQMVQEKFENRAKSDPNFARFVDLVKQKTNAEVMVARFQSDAVHANAELAKITFSGDTFILVSDEEYIFGEDRFQRYE